MLSTGAQNNIMSRGGQSAQSPNEDNNERERNRYLRNISALSIDGGDAPVSSGLCLDCEAG